MSIPSEIADPFEEFDYVPLTNDLLFHMVFTKNEFALKSLLSSILNIPVDSMERIEILNPMQYSDGIDSKLTVLDLKLHLNGQKFILVEMQVRKFLYWTNRTLAYACRQISDQVKGVNFEYNLIQPVVQIAIMDHTLFPDHKRFLSRYLLRDEENYLYSDKLEFVVMDLTAVDEADEEEKKQGLVAWANAFRADDWDSVKKIDNEGVQEAMKTMSLIMATPSERQMIWDRKMAIIDYNYSIAGAMAEGRKEGRKEGENRLMMLISRLSEQNRFDDIKRCTSDPEYREQLYRELL